MLTQQQLGLFRRLDLDPDHEKEIRLRHKTCVQDYGAVKDFTRWLTKMLYRRWEQERGRNTTPYLGD